MGDPDESHRIDLAASNQLAYAYGIAPDSAQKEAMLLQLLERFHGYVMKYLIMILRGTIPNTNSIAGRESEVFLRTLAPRGSKATAERTSATCKMLHLAFKGRSTEEIYDTLAFCFMRAARKYDPYHTDKVGVVCKAIYAEKEFTAAELETRVGFDPSGILRALVRKGFLSSVVGKKRKVVGYRTAAAWPPPPSLFEAGPIGFAYVVQIWFRFYLNGHIVGQMCEIETDENMMQMFDPRIDSDLKVGGNALQRAGYGECLARHNEGNCTNANGTTRYMADRSLMDMPLDVSKMSLAWVAETSDKLFAECARGNGTFFTSLLQKEWIWRDVAHRSGPTR